MLHIKSISTFVVACRSPKVFFNCSTAGTGEVGLQCARTCLNLDSDDCVSCFCHYVFNNWISHIYPEYNGGLYIVDVAHCV